MSKSASTLALMRTLLDARNRALLHDFDSLALSLANATVPPLLRPYQKRLQDWCQHWAKVAAKNLSWLKLQQDSILEDVRSDTQQAMRYCRLISERMAAPVLRAADTDSVCLRLLSWMHNTHPRTKNIPVAFSEGGVSVFTFLVVVIAALYYVPRLVQRSLLYLPLYFHEFGHLLYRLHKPEMDDLVRELQEKVDQAMKPMSRRNDRHAEVQAAHRRKVVAAWYNWTTELFCDAVGLEMGGPAYLHAFSNYLGLLSQGDYYRSAQDLGSSSHPITWWRIRLLVRRAKSLGLEQEAIAIEKEWSVVASTLGINEDYHGFYDEVLEDSIDSIISDMLVEVAPRRFLPEEANPSRDWQPGDSPVYLFNYALRKSQANPSNYPRLEEDLIKQFLCLEQHA